MQVKFNGFCKFVICFLLLWVRPFCVNGQEKAGFDIWIENAAGVDTFSLQLNGVPVLHKKLLCTNQESGGPGIFLTYSDSSHSIRMYSEWSRWHEVSALKDIYLKESLFVATRPLLLTIEINGRLFSYTIDLKDGTFIGLSVPEGSSKVGLFQSNQAWSPE